MPSVAGCRGGVRRSHSVAFPVECRSEKEERKFSCLWWMRAFALASRGSFSISSYELFRAWSAPFWWCAISQIGLVCRTSCKVGGLYQHVSSQSGPRWQLGWIMNSYQHCSHNCSFQGIQLIPPLNGVPCDYIQHVLETCLRVTYEGQVIHMHASSAVDVTDSCSMGQRRIRGGVVGGLT